MKIGIDARFYGGSYAKGLGRYTQKLIEHLGQIDKENEYVIFLRQENWDLYKPAGSNFKKVLADFPWYSWQEQIQLPKVLKREKLDLMHFPHFNVPLFYRGKFIVTIHDLIILRYPTRRATTLGPILYWLKNIAFRIVIRRAVKKSAKIIAVSEFAKKDIVHYFKIDPDKVAVTYEACELVGVQSKLDLGLFKKRFGITGPYLLYVGNAYPHKNLEGLVDVFKRLKQEKPELQLILVGKEDYFYQRLKRQVEELGLFDPSKKSQTVIFTGFINDEDLGELYQNCLAYVFPSFYEGFGLPPLEAMTYRVPVVAANTSSLPEVLKSAAHFFDPYNRQEMYTKIKEVIDNQDLRKQLIEKGFKLITQYSWHQCAEVTQKVYNTVINTGS